MSKQEVKDVERFAVFSKEMQSISPEIPKIVVLAHPANMVSGVIFTGIYKAKVFDSFLTSLGATCGEKDDEKIHFSYVGGDYSYKGVGRVEVLKNTLMSFSEVPFLAVNIDLSKGGGVLRVVALRGENKESLLCRKDGSKNTLTDLGWEANELIEQRGANVLHDMFGYIHYAPYSRDYIFANVWATPKDVDMDEEAYRIAKGLAGLILRNF